MHTDPSTSLDRPAGDAGGAGRRTRLAWYAYDLGNTSVEFAIPLYLTTWIVSDLGVPAWLFGIASAASSWAIGLSGPYIGVRADETQTRKRWFMTSAIVATLLLAILGLLPRTGWTALAGVVAVAMAANYFFQLSSLIYNASMLQAARGENVVSVSSLGMALSFFGGLAGVGVIEAFISGHVVPGVIDRGYALLPAAIIFMGCSIPSILSAHLWQKKTDQLAPPAGRLHQRMRTLWQESAHEYRAGWFLAGYFMLNTSVMGMTLYLPLHVQAITGIQGFRLLMIFGLVVISSALGAGSIVLINPDGPMVKRLVIGGLVLLGLNAFAFSLVTSLALVVLCCCLHGLFSGALVPMVRGAYARTWPAEYQALAFGLFGAVQRVSQGLGAALWPIAGTLGADAKTAAGVAAMGVLAFIGVPLFTRWKPARSMIAGESESAAPAGATVTGGGHPAETMGPADAPNGIPRIR
jgi:MFS-type transporter involved in bile tolerance (Atg22 family)